VKRGKGNLILEVTLILNGKMMHNPMEVKRIAFFK
jgi:hypothetical protein